MAQSRRPLVVGNWKMNGRRDGVEPFVHAIRKRLTNDPAANCDVAVCPPAVLITDFASTVAGSSVAVGAQDCHIRTDGAHTGDISAEMIADSGGTMVIVGHSERRTDHGETDAMIRGKAGAAHRAGLTAIVCVGETAAERESGDALAVVAGQVRNSVPPDSNASNTVVAYEPVWAIGSGVTPTVKEVAEMHREVRRILAETHSDGEAFRVLYGGSVKPSNAAELLAIEDVDGALVGGASLNAVDFVAIIDSCP